MHETLLDREAATVSQQWELASRLDEGRIPLDLSGGVSKLHIHAWLANIVVFFSQLSLTFSLVLFTWRDRTVSRSGKLKPGAQFIKRWSTFHSSILVTALLNQLVFMLAGTVVPSLWASTLGILVAACVNFFVMNCLVFCRE